MHLRIDGYARNEGLLTDVAVLAAWLEACVFFIGMTVIAAPRVVAFPGSNGGDMTQKPGLSGDVILAESGVMVHTWPEYGLVMLDIFSCRRFDVDGTVAFVEKSFDMVDCRWDWTLRPLGIEV